jgi:hypothetical protein
MHSACASLPLSSRAMWWPPRMGLLQMAHGPADVDAVLASSASSVPGGRVAGGIVVFLPWDDRRLFRPAARGYIG